MSLTPAERAAVGTLKSMFPPGDEDLYAWEDPASFVARDLATKARLLAAQQSAADNLRAELAPQTAVAKLPDWETALAVDRTKVATGGTVAQRQAQIVGRLREHGTPTRAAVQAALRPLLGYAPTILGHGRAALDALHTYTIPPATIGGSSSSHLAFTVGDNAVCGKAGARIRLKFAAGAASPNNVTVYINSPTRSWTITGQQMIALDDVERVYYWPALAGYPIDGAWDLYVINSDAAAVVLTSGSVVVEGIGRTTFAGAEGLGARAFEWSAFVDESLAGAGYDRDAVRATVARMNPAHEFGGVALAQTGHVQGAICGDPNCIAGLVVVG